MNPTPKNKPPANALPSEKNRSLFVDFADRSGINPPTIAMAKIATNEKIFKVVISTKLAPNSANAAAYIPFDYRVGSARNA